MFFIGLCIAAVVGFLVGQDAAKRGMSAWGWGLFVFLLLIIGLPAYLIVKKPYLNATNGLTQTFAPSSLRKCPYCAELIQNDAIKCKHCMSDLTKGSF
jgi:hypothetical protein